MQKLKRAVENWHPYLAGLLLGVMLLLGIVSMRGDAAIVDEVAHIPAGYSYLKYGDYRLNPEHPPLIKDLAAAPLLMMDLDFPTDKPAWTQDINGQWEAGWSFLYHDGNNADAMLFWSRLPVLLLSVGFGWLLYRFSLKRFGYAAALVATFLYALSPNILAHARLVTTDAGAMVFMFLAFITWLRYLEKPDRKRLAIAVLALAGAQLAKFSSVLLLPFFGLMALVFVFTQPGDFKRRWLKYAGGYSLLLIGTGLLIWLFYLPHTLNMPAAVQDRLIDGSLLNGWPRGLGQQLMRFNDVPIFKPLIQYLLGILMVFNRVGGGNTTYFLGEVTNQSFVWYFPLTFLIKVPLASLALMAGSIFWGVSRYMRQSPFKIWHKFKAYARSSPLEFFSLLFIAFYAYTSITGNLNLGIRHLLPIMPFVFLLVGKTTADIMRRFRAASPLVGTLLAFYAISVLIAFPAFVSYFNESIGGADEAYKYTSDSSVDWGQDLKRLVTYVESNPEIETIAVDYFGGGEPKYYFCDRAYDAQNRLIENSGGYDCTGSVYREWHADNGPYPGRYIAVSETFLMNDIYWAELRGDAGYGYLRAREPIAKIGGSIYVYKLR